MWEEKKQAAQMVSYLNQSRSLKQRKLECGLALHLVLWVALCLSQRAILEMGASLKWMPWQSNLKSGTYITKKRKPSGQGLQYKWLATSNFDMR